MGDKTKKNNRKNYNQESDACITLFDVFPNPIWKAGVNGKYSWVNRAWCEFTGLTIDNAISSDWTKSIHPNDRGRCIRAFKKSFNARQSFKLEYRWKSCSGNYQWVVDQGNPLLDRNGKFQGYIGTCYDISDRKKTEETLRKKITDQERLNQVMIGRELKMIELKTKVKKLEEALGCDQEGMSSK